MTLDLDAIAPENGAKYSPNLHKWLTRSRDTSRHQHSMRTFKDTEEFRFRLMIGWLDRDRNFSGTTLGAVISDKWRDIPKPEIFYFGSPRLLEWEEIADFWERYQRTGRCAIDEPHTMYMSGDKDRFTTAGNTRTCNWCGVVQVLRRWEETVEREAWEMK